MAFQGRFFVLCLVRCTQGEGISSTAGAGTGVVIVRVLVGFGAVDVAGGAGDGVARAVIDADIEAGSHERRV